MAKTTEELLIELSQQVYNMSAEISSFKNEQDGINEKILGYLENNPNTDQKGYIAKVDENSEEIKEIKDKIYKVTTLASVISFVGGFIGKYIYDRL